MFVLRLLVILSSDARNQSIDLSTFSFPSSAIRRLVRCAAAAIKTASALLAQAKVAPEP